MNKAIITFLFCLFFYNANAQSTPGPAELALTDSVCACLTRVDLNKVDSKQDATNAITDCFGKRANLIMKVAQEKNVDETDREAMRNIGIGVGKDLLNENCTAFIKLSEKMVQGKNGDDDGEESSTTGTFKRIELKRFNYFIITDTKGSEKSFLWLRQFPGSEKFMSGSAKFIGKKLKVSWQEMEVYLPEAKGYYKVKEITGIEVL